jgi:hypothetical protein
MGDSLHYPARCGGNATESGRNRHIASCASKQTEHKKPGQPAGFVCMKKIALLANQYLATTGAGAPQLK